MAIGTRRNDLFTAAELKLLAESEGVTLEKASRAVAVDRLKRVRGLRDKWRDLLGHQARKGKRSPQAVADANTRSRQKAELLHAAVARLEQRLANLDGEPAKPAAGTGAVKKRAVKKSSRVAAHRAARAGVRAALTEETAALNRTRSLRPAANRGKEPAEVPAKPEAVASVSSKVSGARRRPRPPVVAAVGAGLQSIRVDRAKQRSARAGAKSARLALKGVSTRRGGHVLASGKRAQARRDKRSR